MSDTADTGALDAHSAASAFESIEAGAQEVIDETPEAAAERLAADELQATEEVAPEEDAGKEESEEAPEPDAVTIEVDGKPVKMTKAELAEAVKGSMRQADYTQKTMAAAAETKAAQAEKQAASADRAKLANQLHVYSVQASGALDSIRAQMTDQLIQEDPQQYMILQRTLEQGQADLAKANADLGELQKQYQAEQAEQRSAYQQSEQQAMLAKLPEWKDSAKAKAEVDKIQQYLSNQGFNGDEIGQIEDHRLVLMARDAMLYKSLMERAGSAAKKVVAAPPKVERPGVAVQTKPKTAGDVAMRKLNQSGKLSPSDAGALFANF